MPLTGCFAASQSANMYTKIYGITRETKQRLPDRVNRNAYNFFLGNRVTASSSAF